MSRHTVVKEASVYLASPSVRGPARLGKVLVDSWGAAVLASHAQLFTRVFQVVELIPESSRQREIIINYWRERVSRRIAISERTSDRLGLTDEGLIQTLLSTVIRAKGLDPGKAEAIGLVREIVEKIPHIDVVFHFQVNRERIEQRVPIFEIRRALNSRTEDWLDQIMFLVEDCDFNVKIVDASLSAKAIQDQLGNLDG